MKRIGYRGGRSPDRATVGVPPLAKQMALYTGGGDCQRQDYKSLSFHLIKQVPALNKESAKCGHVLKLL